MTTPIDRALCCGPTCGRGTDATGPCVAATYGHAIRQRAEAAGYVILFAADHDRRITELLEANNREVERRRKASDVIAWLLIALNAQQLQAPTSDRVLFVTARNTRRAVGDIIHDAQAFRAALPAGLRCATMENADG
jgi:hypothetical protein